MKSYLFATYRYTKIWKEKGTYCVHDTTLTTSSLEYTAATVRTNYECLSWRFTVPCKWIQVWTS